VGSGRHHHYPLGPSQLKFKQAKDNQQQVRTETSRANRVAKLFSLKLFYSEILRSDKGLYLKAFDFTLLYKKYLPRHLRKFSKNLPISIKYSVGFLYIISL